MKTISFYTVFAIMIICLCIESIITYVVALFMVFVLYCMVRGKSDAEIKSLMGNDFFKKLGKKSKFMNALIKEEEETVC